MSESDVYRRQIMTNNVDPCAVRDKIHISAKVIFISKTFSLVDVKYLWQQPLTLRALS